MIYATGLFYSPPLRRPVVFLYKRTLILEQQKYRNPGFPEVDFLPTGKFLNQRGDNLMPRNPVAVYKKMGILELIQKRCGVVS